MATEYTVQTVQESPAIEQARMALLKSAEQAVAKPLTVPGYEISPLVAEQQRALQLGSAGIGAYSPYLQQAGLGTTAGAGLVARAADIMQGADVRDQFGEARRLAERSVYQPGFGAAEQLLGRGVGSLAGAAQGFTPEATQAFMNPYQQQVIEESLRQINRQGDIARQNLQAQAVRTGAFGGTREGVQRAELERGLAEQRNAAIVGGLAQGYQSAAQQAQQAFEQQQQRQLAQAQGYQGAAGLSGSLAAQQAGIGQQAAGLYGNLAQQQFGVGSQLASGIGSLGTQLGALGLQQGQLGEAAQRLGQQDVSFLYGLGQQAQAQRQAELDALRATQMQQTFLPFQMLSFQSDILSKTPGSQTALTSTTAPTPSPLTTALSTGIGVASTAAGLKQARLI